MSFGGVRAVVDVDLDVGPGRLVGLIGPNGAGKTTFIDAISGFVRAKGRVEIDGEELTGLGPHRRAQRGLVRTWQSIELFDDLTVRENLLVAAHRPSLRRTLRELVSPPAAGLDRRSFRRSSCSGSKRPWTSCPAISRRDSASSSGSRGRSSRSRGSSASTSRPPVLDTHESEELGRRLRKLVDGGQSMLLVDHDMGLVLGICDEVVVLEFGEVIARGAPDAVRRDERVISAYLGGAAAELARGALDSAADARTEHTGERDRG